MAQQEFLAEDLAAFELGSFARWADDGPVASTEGIGQSVDQRHFRADDGQVRLQALRQSDQAGHICWIGGHAFGLLGNSGVAGSAPNLPDARAFAELPDQRVFAPATADDQNLHPWRFLANSTHRCRFTIRQNTSFGAVPRAAPSLSTASPPPRIC